MKGKVVFIALAIFILPLLSAVFLPSLNNALPSEFFCPEYPADYDYCFTHEGGGISYHKLIPTDDPDIKHSKRVALINKNLVCME